MSSLAPSPLPLSPDLAPLFWTPERLGQPSAWWGHVPFGHWLVAGTAPRLVVELGTHTGVSYGAFCRAAAERSPGTRCVAIDTWEGDEQAGEYGEAVFAELRAWHDSRFAGFSRLLRARFDEARRLFAPGSIDLLHIDGLHSYEAVRHDWETWRPALSDRAVVLFHDIAVRDEGFGVWRLWEELRALRPHFTFGHSYGLGVLAVGGNPPAAVAALCAASGTAAEAEVQRVFAVPGERWLAEQAVRALQGRVHALTEEAAELRRELAVLRR
jgi:hypothetical protein